MKRIANSRNEDVPLARGEGYLTFMGYLQIAVGVLTVVFSAVAIAEAAWIGHTGLFNPVNAATYFGGRATGSFTSLLAGYVAFQISYGWLMGAMLIAAGVCCLKRIARRFVAAVSVVNLVNFPHGTTVAILMLHGLSRPGIAGAFHGTGRPVPTRLNKV